jgi:hypothetical protein
MLLLRDLARYAADGQAYKALGHYIVANARAVLVVPERVADVREAAIRNGVPIPLEEFNAGVAPLPEGLQPAPVLEIPAVLGVALGFEWWRDSMQISPGGACVPRYSHTSGVRFWTTPIQPVFALAPRDA